jgi:glycerophosphoryl diester phosphodiesterase
VRSPPPTTIPQVIANRGASRDAPENTLAAFDAALRQGCQAMELDLQLTRDGVPVVYHDRTLSRAGGGRRRISRLALAELAGLDPGRRLAPAFAGEHSPSLEEVLERYGRQTELLLEIKVREEHPRVLELLAATVGLVERLDLMRRVLLLCFDPLVLDAAAARAPALRRVLKLRPGPTLDRRLAARLPDLHAVSADVRSLTPAFGHAVRGGGCQLLVYTCNTPRQVRRALAADATGIMSDRPGWLARTLAQADAAR